MNDDPSAGVHILIGDSLGLSVEFEFKVAWRKDVKSGRGSVLNDEGWLLSFGDYSAESCEWFGDSFWLNGDVR